MQIFMRYKIASLSAVTCTKSSTIRLLPPESSKKRNDNHFCALKSSKRCGFCEIGFFDEENDDVKAKYMKSLDLFEGSLNS